MVRAAYQTWEDNKKEANVDESLKSAYMVHKGEFERILELVKAIANVLDQDLPNY